jgi:hypothetical protein
MPDNKQQVSRTDYVLMLMTAARLNMFISIPEPEINDNTSSDMVRKIIFCGD